MTFVKFKFFVVSAIVEYLNNIEQHSYDDLTDAIWWQCYEALHPSFHSNAISEIILNKLPPGLLTNYKLTKFHEIIQKGIREFILDTMPSAPPALVRRRAVIYNN